jgi:transcriptional regulator with XRE-family HTH domain
LTYSGGLVYNYTQDFVLRFTKNLYTFVTPIVTIMNIRLKQFLAAGNISQSQFADTIKVVRASVSHVLAGRNKPGYDFIKAIMVAYPHLNMEWLIMGKGKMYKSALEQSQPSIQQQPGIPMQEEETPLLFNYDQDEDTSTDEQLIEPAPTSHEKHGTPNPHTLQEHSINSINNTTLTTDRQRKAIRIAVFYNDGTYQEFQNI